MELVNSQNQIIKIGTPRDYEVKYNPITNEFEGRGARQFANDRVGLKEKAFPMRDKIFALGERARFIQ